MMGRMGNLAPLLLLLSSPVCWLAPPLGSCPPLLLPLLLVPACSAAGEVKSHPPLVLLLESDTIERANRGQLLLWAAAHP